MRTTLVVFLCCTQVQQSLADCWDGSLVSTAPTKTSGVAYGQRFRPGHTNGHPNTMDFYEIVPDSRTAAPVFLWMHGGEWSYGDSNQGLGMADWMNAWAVYGVKAFSVDYMKLNNWLSRHGANSSLEVGFMEGPTLSDDFRQAAAFVQTNAGTYKPDMTRLMVGGTAAGAWGPLWYGYISRTVTFTLSGKSRHVKLQTGWDSANDARVIFMDGISFPTNGGLACCPWGSPGCAKVNGACNGNCMLWLNQKEVSDTMASLGTLQAQHSNSIPLMVATVGELDCTTPAEGVNRLLLEAASYRIPTASLLVEGGLHGQNMDIMEMNHMDDIFDEIRAAYGLDDASAQTPCDIGMRRLKTNDIFV